MIVGILATAQYWWLASKVVGNKNAIKNSQRPDVTVAPNGSVQHDVDDQKAGAFVISENPANITMCDGDLQGCQDFDILVSIDPEPEPAPFPRI